MALIIVLMLSMAIKRPWCNFLCPICPVTDFIRLVRGGMINLWQTTAERYSLDDLAILASIVVAALFVIIELGANVARRSCISLDADERGRDS